MHQPKTLKQVWAFLGLVGYYRKFIKHFAKIAKPLTLLICQPVKFDWTLTHHDAFLKLKESIIQALILQYPNPNKRYRVYTNASDYQMTPSKHNYLRNMMVQNSLLPFFHIPSQKHNHRTGSLWSLLFHNQMELLSPSSIYHSVKWSQTTQQIP